jgi:serine phosphatase RsbU (regulator of sigma subunit)
MPAECIEATRILVIDDDANVRKLFVQFLSRESYSIDEAASGEEGLARIAEKEYSLVITDLQMQQVDGLGVLQAARQKDEYLPVLIVTGFGSIPTAVHAMKMGAFEYLTKPLQSDTLLIKVKNALERRRLQLQLLQQQQKLDEQRRLFEQDLELARQVQASLVPNVYVSARAEVAVHLRPIMAIGGDQADVYDDGNGHLYLSVIDVTGHGIAAALMVSRVSSELNNLTRRRLTPKQVLFQLNQFCLANFTGTSLFLTIFCCCCDLEKRTLTYSASAHPSALLWRHDDRRFAELASQNRIIGFAPAPEEQFVQETLPFHAADRLLIYTDGLSEAENSDGMTLGKGGLRAMAQRVLTRPPEQAAAHLIEQVVAFGEGETRDDLLVLICDFK